MMLQMELELLYPEVYMLEVYCLCNKRKRRKKVPELFGNSTLAQDFPSNDLLGCAVDLTPLFSCFRKSVLYYFILI